MSGNGFQLLDIILLAVVAGFIILRLRGVLGKRTGHQERLDPFTGQARRDTRPDERVVRFPERETAGEPNPDTAGIRAADLPADATPLSKGLAQIAEADSSFEQKEFASGARAAFEMILQAYARGDLKALRPLLANEVFEEFAGAVRARDQAGEILETTLVGIVSAEIVEAELTGKTAFVTVKFVTEQINVTKNAEGQAIDGTETHVDTITDLWTFARNTRSRDPNWALVATDTPE